MSQLNPTDKLVRKLRKKLRQIERLELTGRHSLNADEISKVSLEFVFLVKLLVNYFLIVGQAKTENQRAVSPVIETGGGAESKRISSIG